MTAARPYSLHASACCGKSWCFDGLLSKGPGGQLRHKRTSDAHESRRAHTSAFATLSPFPPHLVAAQHCVGVCVSRCPGGGRGARTQGACELPAAAGCRRALQHRHPLHMTQHSRERWRQRWRPEASKVVVTLPDQASQGISLGAQALEPRHHPTDAVFAGTTIRSRTAAAARPCNCTSFYCNCTSYLVPSCAAGFTHHTPRAFRTRRCSASSIPTAQSRDTLLAVGACADSHGLRRDPPTVRRCRRVRNRCDLLPRPCHCGGLTVRGLIDSSGMPAVLARPCSKRRARCEMRASTN